jgi:Yip1-like protein
MAETVAPPVTETAAPQGLIARIFGVLLAPRKTYAGVAARPRSLGMLAVVLLIIATGSVVFSSTEIGRQALLDQQVRTMESFGIKLPEAAYQQMQERMSRPFTPYLGAAAAVVFVPIVLLVIAGIAFAIFNAILGGDATFKQAYAVVVHSSVISAFQQLFVYPLDYARESMSSATNLAVFLPFLDENTFPARLLGGIDLFVIWWMVNLAIGLGVLYKRRTGPIAVGMLAVYLAIALAIAGVKTALSGA